ncbi:alpha/beta fold hydrolase [Streptomyces chartreusis]
MATAVRDLTGAEGGPVDLVGFSGGCTSALRYAAAYPERIRRLAAIEPAWIGNAPSGGSESRYLAGLDTIMALHDEEVGPAFIRYFAPRRHLSDDMSVSVTILREAVPGMRNVWKSWRCARSTSPELEHIDADFLILAGDHSHPRMLDAARLLAARVRRSYVHVVAGHDHFTITAAATHMLATFLIAQDLATATVPQLRLNGSTLPPV